jgi:hypothetical protein
MAAPVITMLEGGDANAKPELRASMEGYFPFFFHFFVPPRMVEGFWGLAVECEGCAGRALGRLFKDMRFPVL